MSIRVFFIFGNKTKEQNLISAKLKIKNSDDKFKKNNLKTKIKEILIKELFFFVSNCIIQLTVLFIFNQKT